MKRNLLFLILWSVPLFNFAQQEDAWVYLTDKQNVAASLSNPISILTQKAIDRKNAHGEVIDERDVPVNENYISQLKAEAGITVMAKSKWFNAVHVRGTETDINALLGLSFVSAVDFADKSLNTGKQVSQKKESRLETATANFNYGNALNQIRMFNGDQLHRLNYTGSGMTIAVLDAGFPNVNTMAAFKRLRDAGHLLDDYDFVNRDNDVYTNTESNHGTLVLSTMAGFVQDRYAGTAPDASYYLFITEDASNENSVEESYWVEAAERADSLGVDIINSSLGYGSFYDNPNYNYPASDFDGNTAYITKGANIAFEKGLLIVNSAGNEGANGVNAPADAAGVFSIGAVKSDGTYASFSSVGSSIQPTQKPDVVTQGQGSYVITQNDVIATANGTSFSSPIMAGGVACLWQAFPDRTNAEIMQLIRESASQYNNPDYFLGYGIPDLKLAFDMASAIKGGTDADIELIAFPNPAREMLYFIVPPTENTLEVALFNILGKWILDATISEEENEIDVSSLSTGLYIAKVKSNSISKSFKIVKY